MVRQVSFNSEKIEWSEHEVWYTRALERTDVIFLLGFSDEGMEQKLIGQVRYVLETPESAEISISLHSGYRGTGNGSLLLKASLEHLHRHSNVTTILARVKSSNRASLKFFEKCGFVPLESPDVGTSEETSVTYILHI